MKKLIVTLLVLTMAFSVFAQGAAEAAPAAKAEKQELVIYSAASQTETEYIRDAFNKVHPEVEVTIIAAGSGDLVTRVKTEWPKPEGDVIFLMGTENLDQIIDNLQGYKSANDAKFSAEYKDANAEPKYYATSMPLQAIMYNTDMLKGEDAPKSWADLADPKYKGQIVLANPAGSGSAYAQLYMMNKLYGMDFVKKVVANSTYVAKSQAAPDSVARGEYAITVTGEGNIGQKLAAGDPVAYVLPAEGTGFRIEGSAILANCKNLEAAKKFIDFLTSKDAAEVIRSDCKRRSVSQEVEGPDGLPALADMKFFEYDAIEAKNLKKGLVAEFQGLL